jgi:hypothetical protein
VDSLLLFDGAFPVALDGLVALAGFDVDTDDAGEAEDVKPDDRPVVVFNEWVVGVGPDDDVMLIFGPLTPLLSALLYIRSQWHWTAPFQESATVLFLSGVNDNFPFGSTDEEKSLMVC